MPGPGRVRARRRQGNPARTHRSPPPTVVTPAEGASARDEEDEDGRHDHEGDDRPEAGDGEDHRPRIEHDASCDADVDRLHVTPP